MGKKVKIRSYSYGTYDKKSWREDVLMRKQVCADEANYQPPRMLEIAVFGFMSAEDFGLPTRESISDLPSKVNFGKSRRITFTFA